MLTDPKSAWFVNNKAVFAEWEPGGVLSSTVDPNDVGLNPDTNGFFLFKKNMFAYCNDMGI